MYIKNVDHARKRTYAARLDTKHQLLAASTALAVVLLTLLKPMIVGVEETAAHATHFRIRMIHQLHVDLFV